MTTEYADEFPLLASIGLYATPTSGEGNCLFHALADQLYGDESRHAEIRARVVRHMSQHIPYFLNFFSMPLRRAPKRKAASSGGRGSNTRGRGGRGGKSTTSGEGEFMGGDLSDNALVKGFEQHLKQMSRLGTYGDNMEISAFAREYGVEVRVYQMDFTYIIGPGDFVNDGGGGTREEKDYDVDMVFIAYHSWEHYSSIRNISGPHTGHPQVRPLSASGRPTIPTPSTTTATCKPWMLDMAKRSLTFHLPDSVIQDAIIAARGNVNAAVDKLLMLEDGLADSDEAETNTYRSRESTKSDEEKESLRTSATPPPMTPSRQAQLKSSRSASPAPRKAAAVRKSARIREKKGAGGGGGGGVGGGAGGKKGAGGGGGTQSVPVVAGPISKKKKRELMRAAKNSGTKSDAGGEDTGGDTDSGGVVRGIRELYV